MLQAWTGSINGRTVINASFTQGDTISWAWTVSNNNTALNLTGYIIKMTIGFPNPVVLTTSSGGISSATPSSGQFSVIMSSTTTAAFSSGTYSYDIWLESSSSPPVENQYFTGQITVYQSVTTVP